MFIAIDPFELPESVAPTGSGATTYPNGYGFRRALRIAGEVLTGTSALDDLPLRFDETLASFKTVANGGNVVSSSGWDILFTDRLGTKIPHELETYDGAAGRAAAWVLPPTPVPGVDLDLYVYYGKSVSGPEANPQGMWANALVSIRMPDGQDMSPGGRHMTSSGVGTGTILGMPGATMTSSSFFESTSPGWWNGLAAGTTAAWVQITSLPTNPDVGGNIMRIGGSAAGTGQHGLWVDASATDVTPALTNYIGSTVKIGGALLWDYSGSGVATTGHAFLIATPFAAGDYQDMVIDGVPATVTHNATTPPSGGTTATVSGDVFRIGAANGPPNTNSVVGTVGRVLAWPTTKTPDFLAFMDLNARYPHAVYGIGDEDAAADTDRSPVMAPVTGAALVGGSSDINVLAHASDPDGGQLLAGLSTPTPLFGTASIVANLVRYARTSTGTDRIGITATVGAKTAKALLTVTTGTGAPPPPPPPPPGGDGNLPVAPKTQRITAWQLIKSSGGSASIVEGADSTTGVHLKGGSVSTNTSANAIGMATVKALSAGSSAGMVMPPFTLSFDYWRGTADPTVPDGNGIFCQVDFYRRKGTNANLASLGTQSGTGEWTADYSPTDTYYSNNGVTPVIATGVRFSFDTHSLGGTGDNQIRGRALHDDGSIVAFNPPTLQVFNFGSRSNWTRLDWSVPGDTVTVTATWPDGTTTTQTFDDPEISSFFGVGTASNIVLMAYANRDARFRNVDFQSSLAGGGVLADYVAATGVLASGHPSRVDVTSKSAIPTTVAQNKQYTITQNISFGSAGSRDNASNTITMGGGVLNATAYLRGHNEASASPSNWPELSNGTIELAAKALVIRGLRLRNMRFVLKSGAKQIQIESNYISDFYEGYQNGFVFHDGDQTCDHILIAFNRYSDDVDTVSGPLLRVLGNSAGGTGLAPLNHVVIYRNHINGFRVGPQIGPGTGTSAPGRSRIVFTGDHDADEFRDLALNVQENLATDWRSSGPFSETKYAGATFLGNVFELGAVTPVNNEGQDVGKNTPLQVRIRHGRTTGSTAVDIDSGIGAVVDGNLWIGDSSSSFTNSGVNLRDGFHRVNNNWAVNIGPGAQPNAGSTVLAASKVEIALLSGILNWNGYPGNSTPGSGENLPNAGKCKVGGNHCVVTVGEGSGTYSPQFNPEKCRVGPQGGSRVDRNVTVSRVNETTPDSGTVVGADFSLVPKRLRGGPDNGFGTGEYDVGPAAWDPSYYGKSD